MTVYVDELRKYPNAPRCFRWGACHMTTDGPIDELHAMAEKLELRRGWFQDHPRHPHYDLSVGKRKAALEAGCVFKPAVTQILERQKGAWQPIHTRIVVYGLRSRPIL